MFQSAFIQRRKYSYILQNFSWYSFFSKKPLYFFFQWLNIGFKITHIYNLEHTLNMHPCSVRSKASRSRARIKNFAGLGSPNPYTLCVRLVLILPPQSAHPAQINVFVWSSYNVCIKHLQQLYTHHPNNSYTQKEMLDCSAIGKKDKG